jgi:methylamine dehydrogenase heavy chain
MAVRALGVAARSSLAGALLRFALGVPLAGLVSAPAAAEVPIGELGRVERLPDSPGDHWVWVADPVLRRSALVDLDSGEFLGTVDGGFGLVVPLDAVARPEVYVPETHYSRGSRGVRTDVLTIYDRTRLAPVGEVVLPPERAISAVPLAHAALTDDDRFAAVFNLTPATSLSIVDLPARTLAGEIEIPGCSLVYPAGDRRLISLCNDGGLLTVDLDDAGREASKRRSPPFFDLETDPVTEDGVRRGSRWYFFSVDGRVHPIELAGAEPRFEEKWSLVEEADRGWRMGGRRHTAVHAATGRLFVLMHEGGGQESYKDAGTEVWVFDLDERKRVARIELENPGPTVMGVPLEFGRDWMWPFSGLSRFVLGRLPALVEEIQVTQDAAPLLVTSATLSGGIGVYDARDGAFLKRVYSGNLTNVALHGRRAARAP